MKEEIIATTKRAGRTTVDLAIAALVAHFTGNESWLALAPVIAAVGKFLRCVFRLNFIPF